MKRIFAFACLLFSSCQPNSIIITENAQGGESNAISITTASTSTFPPVETNMPSVTTIPEVTSTPTPFLEEHIEIAGNNPAGLEWYAPVSGTYEFKYFAGAYSPWPTDAERATEGAWRTIVYGYHNCETEWELSENENLGELVQPDIQIGQWKTRMTTEEAQNFSQGMPGVFANLHANECILLIAIDTYEPTNQYYAYGDNRGNVVITISGLK